MRSKQAKQRRAERRAERRVERSRLRALARIAAREYQHAARDAGQRLDRLDQALDCAVQECVAAGVPCVAGEPRFERSVESQYVQLGAASNTPRKRPVVVRGPKWSDPHKRGLLKMQAATATARGQRESRTGAQEVRALDSKPGLPATIYASFRFSVEGTERARRNLQLCYQRAAVRALARDVATPNAILDGPAASAGSFASIVSTADRQCAAARQERAESQRSIASADAVLRARWRRYERILRDAPRGSPEASVAFAARPRVPHAV